MAKAKEKIKVKVWTPKEKISFPLKDFDSDHEEKAHYREIDRFVNETVCSVQEPEIIKINIKHEAPRQFMKNARTKGGRNKKKYQYEPQNVGFEGE